MESEEVSLSAPGVGSNEAYGLCRQSGVRGTCAGDLNGKWSSLGLVSSNQNEQDNRDRRMCMKSDMDREKIRLC